MLKKLSKKERGDVVTKGYLDDTLDERNYVTKDYLHKLLDDRDYITKSYFHDHLEESFTRFRKKINQDFRDQVEALIEDNHSTTKILIESFENKFEYIESRLNRV